MNRQQINIEYIKKKYSNTQYLEIFDLKIISYQDERDRPCMRIWKGRQQNPFVAYFFQSTERREKSRLHYIQKAEERQNEKEQRKAERKAFIPQVAPGTIFRDSWGWDQTQVDYYQLIEMASTHFAIVKPIQSQTVPGSEGRDYDSVTPIKDSFVENAQPLKVKITSCGLKDNGQTKHCFRVNSYSYALEDSGKPAHRSWYA